MKVGNSDQVQGLQQQKHLQEQDDQKLKRACKQFEGIFIASMLKESLSSNSAKGERKGNKPFESLRELTIEMTGESLASQENGGIGLWKDLYQTLKQEKASREYKKQMGGSELQSPRGETK